MEAVKHNALEVQKYLMRSKVMANFSHYIAGNLYYTVKLDSGLYQFPIPVVEESDIATIQFEKGEEPSNIIRLSSDLGTTQFDSEIKATFLNRWIKKAIKNDELIPCS